ncbi:MAG: hypothetical protein PWP54_1539 [Thermosipho sp. (in: thermotogales)]|nr:hypothetical protein [Thermosipho sp. (in: thermotogales)]
MKEIRRKNFKNGFTLIELIFVLAIIGGILLVAVLSYSKISEFSIKVTLKANQKVLMEAVTSIVFDTELPSYSNVTNSNYVRNELKEKLANTGVKIYNPLSKSDEIISTTQANSVNSAAVVISQRKVGIEQAISNPDKYLYPLNASESSKEKFNGALIIQICEDGYILYAYLNGNIYNLEYMYF